MYDCEHDLEEALEQFRADPDKWSRGDYTVEVPLFAVEDAIQRLKRYEQIVSNLTDIGLMLWSENLRKYGDRRIHEKETPQGVREQDTFVNMCAFVNELPKSMDIEDGFVELALQLARFDTGDPTGLTQYMDKEDDLFQKLEDMEEGNG
jgi:hypothetical protein